MLHNVKDSLDILCEKRHETAANLADLFGVSKQTIYNDLVALSCSYPIEPVRGRYGGGISIPDWYHQSRRVLSPKQEALLRKLRLSLVGEDLAVMNSILAQFAVYRGL